ncbi:MAG: peptide deformylase [Candidatus Uhrbacteria bacterium]
MPHAPLAILTYPDPKLRQQAVEVDAVVLKQLRSSHFIDRLVETMSSAGGVGIAAPQVGVLLRIIVITNQRGPVVYINPTVTSQSLRSAVDIEGCLSVPGIIGTVRRARNVTVRARDLNFRLITRRVRDLPARILQHEVDHLNGVLFIDRAIKTAESPHAVNGESPI